MTVGSWGEEIAESYLKKKGYTILNRNFRSKIGELDIVARDGNVIVFIEVKTRNKLSYGLPCESINEIKKRHIKRMADFYTMINNIEDIDLRIDVIEIFIIEDTVSVHHIENAF